MLMVMVKSCVVHNPGMKLGSRVTQVGTNKMLTGEYFADMMLLFNSVECCFLYQHCVLCSADDVSATNKLANSLVILKLYTVSQKKTHQL